MKRIYLFLGAVLLSSASLFTACKSDNNNVDLPPTVNFVTGANYISSNDTLTVNTQFQVKILAVANVTSGSKIQSLKLTRVFNLQSSDTTYSGFNDATLSLIITFPGIPEPGQENIEFKVTDKDGQSATINLTIAWTAVVGRPDWQFRDEGADGEININVKVEK
jgi:hypothetical protein